MKATGRSIGQEVSFVNGQLLITPLTSDRSRQVDLVVPSMAMVEACRADEFTFFQPFIDAGTLTVGQMRHAARRYHLGKTRSGRPIFWMIDAMCSPLDAHITPDTWMSTLLKAREPLLRYWHVQHCLFGEHLLSHTDVKSVSSMQSVVEKQSVSSVKSVVEDLSICVVESEQSAVVLSALFPESLWMAYVSPSHLCDGLFAPLQGRRVTIFPRTDPSSTTYLFFADLAASLRHCLDIRITVSSILEDYASDSQKERCIDLVDLLLEDSP